MNIEQEFLEQIAEEPWPLARCRDFIASYKDPWSVLRALHADGCIELRRGAAEAPMPDWQAEALFRAPDGAAGAGATVAVTERGAKRAYG